ncbi:sulfite reductase subunit beta [Saccharomonospora azurea]|uniref:sulfite reductase subunit beta n=1 Tax=Saccharomonospora azurea TaxID=40988 RepID=UPI0033278CBC
MIGRTRRDACPGVLRPWLADDGALVRLRLPGGAVAPGALAELLRVAERHGDGAVYLTSRANLQVRGLAHTDGRLSDEVVDAVLATGLVPSPTHERVRNIMVSPLTGRSGGRADLRPVVGDFDARLCGESRLSALSGRFLFVLDDGRGDLAGRDLDLGLVAVDAEFAQLRAGSTGWGAVVPLGKAAETLTALAIAFVEQAGTAPDSPWHVDELDSGGAGLLGVPQDRRADTRVSSGPPPLGKIAQQDGRVAEHVPVPDGRLDAHLMTELDALSPRELIVTPWRTVVVPDLENA